MPSKSAKQKIHKWALAGGAKVGVLSEIPSSVVPLYAEEIVMVIHVASLFGISLTKSAAEGVAAELGLIGTAIFEAVNVGYPYTIPAKIAIAAGVLETFGNTAYSYFEKHQND